VTSALAAASSPVRGRALRSGWPEGRAADQAAADQSDGAHTGGPSRQVEWGMGRCAGARPLPGGGDGLACLGDRRGGGGHVAAGEVPVHQGARDGRQANAAPTQPIPARPGPASMTSGLTAFGGEGTPEARPSSPARQLVTDGPTLSNPPATSGATASGSTDSGGADGGRGDDGGGRRSPSSEETDPWKDFPFGGRHIGETACADGFCHRITGALVNHDASGWPPATAGHLLGAQ
jgi:hypothetical protein